MFTCGVAEARMSSSRPAVVAAAAALSDNIWICGAEVLEFK